MSDQVTEVASLSLVAGTDVRSGDAKRVWQESLKTVAAQKGCNSVFWGMQVENKDVAQLVIGTPPTSLFSLRPHPNHKIFRLGLPRSTQEVHGIGHLPAFLEEPLHPALRRPTSLPCAPPSFPFSPLKPHHLPCNRVFPFLLPGRLPRVRIRHELPEFRGRGEDGAERGARAYGRVEC